jgi:hypothetical protein
MDLGTKYLKNTIPGAVQMGGAILVLLGAGVPVPQTKEHILLAKPPKPPAMEDEKVFYLRLLIGANRYFTAQIAMGTEIIFPFTIKFMP